jgi:beta-galactosidase/beta-glucuronidase
MQRKLAQLTDDPELEKKKKINLEKLRQQKSRPSTARGFEKWKFMWDENEEGEALGWHFDSFDDSLWHDIAANSWWEKQPVGKKWKKEHGIDYNGLAWYRTSFKLDSSNKGKKVVVVFGAVDEACRVWVNGKLLLNRPFPYKGNKNSWGETFEVDITKYARLNGWNTIVVEVEDRSGAGGIWKGVSLKK